MKSPKSLHNDSTSGEAVGYSLYFICLFLKIQRQERYWKCRVVHKSIITIPQGRKLIKGKIQMQESPGLYKGLSQGRQQPTCTAEPRRTGVALMNIPEHLLGWWQDSCTNRVHQQSHKWINSYGNRMVTPALKSLLCFMRRDPRSKPQPLPRLAPFVYKTTSLQPQLLLMEATLICWRHGKKCHFQLSKALPWKAKPRVANKKKTKPLKETSRTV